MGKEMLVQVGWSSTFGLVEKQLKPDNSTFWLFIIDSTLHA